MKLEQVKKHLVKNQIKNRTIRKEFRNNNCQLSKDLKIIGITGSRGKSTTALMIHHYLKTLGYKSVLYSSVMVDSPASFLKPNEAYEVAIRDKTSLLNIIEEVETYGADFLVLEINESTLAKGIVKDIPFNVRVLTNLNPKHNLEQYTEDEYVELKQSFFKDIEDECKCIIGFQDYSKELLDNLLQLNNYPKLICSSNYIATLKGLDKKQVTCLLTGLVTDTDGMEMKFEINKKTYQLKTNLMMRYNALNILIAVTVLESLKVLDVVKFEQGLEKLIIPGRAEKFNVNNRLIVVDTHLPAMLECLKELKDEGKVNKIKVIIGSMGYGYKYWEERFKTEAFIKQRKEVRKYAMNLLKNNADYVYITESDSGKENVEDICKELQNYLGQNIPSVIITDREQAIRQAIKESQKGDVIFISGRGNRKVLCNSEATMKLIKDSDVVKQTLKELGW